MEIDEYRKMAAVEDAMWYYGALHAHLRRALAQGIGARSTEQATRPAAEARILDAGCGTGGLIRRMSTREPAWKWTGLDLSPLACELARARCAAEIREGSVTALPFPDASFDAVVSADVIYHVDDDQAALHEFARVLRPGGVVVINVPAQRWLWSYHDEATHAKRRYGMRELKEKMRLAEFEEVEAKHWNALLLPVVAVRRKLMPAPRSGSDVQVYPAAVEAGFRGVMALERGLMRAGMSFPFGMSILATGFRAA